MILQKMSEPIDFIFPYVDANDPIWQKIYNDEVDKRLDNDKLPKKLAVGDDRFKENGLLKYVFRSIDRHLPWINKVHMIVQSDSQVPEWINRENVNIIYHKDFIPEEYLPTFNSGTIEMFLHNINDLSEKFIYGNDDTFINYDFLPSDFFVGNKLIFGVKKRLIHKNWIWDMTLRLNDQKLLNMTSTMIYEIQHTVIPHSKSIMKKVFNIYRNKILDSISSFRQSKNYNQWIFSLYYYKYGISYNRFHPYLKGSISNKSYNKLLNNWEYYKTICVNDTNDKIRDKFIELFNNKFPKKSKYEM